ncbi:MAG: two-component system, OmpR family, response regulator [Actinomycetota bacterium]|nr:two-component system, OmpR family, response regulator [Actinomycetota bacterium]
MNGNKGRLLVVDDEPNITDLLAMARRYEGFEVSTAGTGRDAVRVARAQPFELIILDVMLPDIDGFEVAKQIGSTGHRVPVLFLTARDATADKVRGLTVGGDDYVTKPFSLEEVVARIHAILRRTQPDGGDSSRIEFADLVMDMDTREVWRDGQGIDLTDTEFRLLRYLMLNPRMVLTRGQILDHVWEYDFGGDANVLDTYIHYLRKKIEVSGSRLIHTVRGVGYSMRVPPEKA